MKHLRLLLAMCLVGLFIPAQAQHPLCDGARFTSKVFESQVRTENIQYGSAARFNGTNINLTLDVYSPPASDNANTNRPLLIMCHGGTFLSGNKDAEEVTFLTREMAQYGFVTASINYRLDDILNFVSGGNDAAFGAVIRATQDLRAAVRFFYKSVAEDGNPYGIDTNAIFVGGSSAGALMALHLAYLEDEADFQTHPSLTNQNLASDLGGFEGNSGNPGFSSKVQGVLNLCGALGLRDWFKDQVPLYSMHGDNDRTVGIDRSDFGLPPTIQVQLDGSRSIHNYAVDSGFRSELFVWPNTDHVPYANATGAARVGFQNDVILFTASTIGEQLCPDQQAVSRNNALLAGQVLAFPNPAERELWVALPRELDGQVATLAVYNLEGRLVHQQTTTLNGTVQIARNAWASGLYLLQVNVAGQQVTRRVSFR
jgi:acetyl esterase/lipase